MGRENILSHLKKLHSTPIDHPGIFVPEESKLNLKDQFQQMAETVGAKLVNVAATIDMESKIAEIYPDCKNIVDTTSRFKKVQTDEFLETPQDASKIDLAIVEGKFGVAENGAIWVTVEQMKYRSILFLSEHLVVLLSSSNLVANMHQAYERLELPKPGFGLFLAGPSKTADIEQSLVIGAHGSRSLSIFLT